MVARTLVDRDIQAGRRLVEELDQLKTSVVAAFWLYEPENDRYRLVLSMPVYDAGGPIAAYGKIQEALKRVPEENRLSIMEVSAVGAEDSTVQALGKAVRTGPGIAGIRFSRSVAEDVYVEDAWIYRTN